MKKDIHPKTYPVIFKFTNGKEIKLNSALGRKDQEIVHNVGDWPLENHAAWTKSHSSMVKSTTSVKKFRAKFGSSLFGGEQSAQEENE
jgi:large subunit ribosomal protein L31